MVAATRSIRSRTRRIASLEPIRGAAPSIDWFSDAPSLPADGAFEVQHHRRQLRCGLDQLTLQSSSGRGLSKMTPRARPSPSARPGADGIGGRRCYGLGNRRPDVPIAPLARRSYPSTSSTGSA